MEDRRLAIRTTRVRLWSSVRERSRALALVRWRRRPLDELPVGELQVRDDLLGYHLAVNAVAVAARLRLDL